jgi:ubiquinone/menaquinone biosynthesis C-methylase UbiE
LTTATGTYLLGASTGEQQRMLYQGEMFRAESAELLDRCGLSPGGRAIDVGCGPLGVLDLLAERVGPDGSLVGLDGSPQMLAAAGRSLAARGIGNAQLVQGDAGEINLPDGAFDLAHTRLVLMNVPDAGAVVDEMVRVVRPGGFVALQDVDWVSRICEPAHPAWDRLVEVLAELWRRRGTDVYLGRRLASMLRHRGCVEVGVHAVAKVFQHGDPYQMLVVERAEICRRPLVEAGLIGPDELGDRIEALRAHLSRPDTLVLHATMFQAWGRKP